MEQTHDDTCGKITGYNLLKDEKETPAKGYRLISKVTPDLTEWAILKPSFTDSCDDEPGKI